MPTFQWMQKAVSTTSASNVEKVIPPLSTNLVVANRIVTVGEPKRAETLADMLDKDTPVFRCQSARGFLTITGRYKGIPMSIISIGMGMAMMDFMVREVRSVVDGPLSIVRFGSCGVLGKATVGDMVISTASAAVTRNYDYFLDHEFKDENNVPNVSGSAYHFSKCVDADEALSKVLTEEMIETIGAEHVVSGANITGDSFYSSQGRVDPTFVDDNVHLLDAVREHYPDALSLEMEVFMLFHLAKCANRFVKEDQVIPGIRAASTMMAFADKVAHLERTAGRAVLNSAIRSLKWEEDQGMLHSSEGTVWEIVPANKKLDRRRTFLRLFKGGKE
jgi:uridine phosphorylase